MPSELLTCRRSGILVPGGFGLRGTEGMILAAKWAREKKVPYLGICLGFQVAVIEFARNVVGLTGETYSDTCAFQALAEATLPRGALGRAA